MKVILSTTNPSKALQIKDIFNNPAIEVMTLREAGISGEAPEEGNTIKENALEKALYAQEHSSEPTWAMADDTGLFITALDGAPGHRAARWAGEDAATEEITQHTLKQLQGKSDRSAIFKTCVAVISPEGKVHYFIGEVRGEIAESPQAPAQPKMPYSPLFSPEGTGKVWSQMTTEEENAISHRGKAFRQVRAFLEEQL